MTRLVTALLAAAVLVTVGGAARAAQPHLVLGIEWKAGGGQLAWRSATTLKPARPSIDVGGASVGLKALSPDGSFAALGRTDGQLRIVRLRPLRSAGTIDTGRMHVAAAIWPSPDRLIAVTGGNPAAVVEVDTRTLRVLARRSLPGELYFAVAAGKRLAALLMQERGIGQADLAIVETDGSFRVRPLPGISVGYARASTVGGAGRMAAPGLTIDPAGTRATVVGRDTSLSVDLKTLDLERFPTRALSRAAKLVEGWGRSVVWLRAGSVAVIERTYSQQDGRPVTATSGLQLRALGSPAGRLLDGTATSAARVGTRVLAYGGTALRGYALDGSLRFELLAGRDTGYVQTAGRYAYVGTGNSTTFSVVDVVAGRVIGTARTSKPTVLLGLP